MVDFTLSEDQVNLQERAHGFAQKETCASAWDYDRDGSWPEAIIDKTWEVGPMNRQVSETCGGVSATSSLEGCLVSESQAAWPPRCSCSAGRGSGCRSTAATVSLGRV